jgi:hypothetical protein
MKNFFKYFLSFLHYMKVKFASDVKFDDFIKLSRPFGKFITFDLQTMSEQESPGGKVKVFLKNFYNIFGVMNYSLIFCCSMASALIESPLNVEHITFGLLLCSSMWISNAMVMIYHRNKRKIRGILCELERFFPKTSEMAKKERKFFTLCHSLHAMSMIDGFITVTFFKLFEGKLMIPRNLDFSFLDLSNAGTAIAFIFWISWAHSFATCVVIFFDISTYTVVSLISLEFRLLSEDFRQFKGDQKELRELIEKHNKLMNLSDQLEELFSGFFLINYLNGSFILCITTFQSAIAKNISEAGAFFNYCLAQLIQLFIRSFYGQQLIDSSSQVANAVFECGWEKFADLRTKKALLMIMMRAQRPSKLTTMKFSTLSLAQFMNVSRKGHLSIGILGNFPFLQISFSTYSYYTFIQQIYRRLKN